MLYFDHASTTPIYPQVLEILNKSLIEDFANPSSAHKLGRGLLEKVNSCREEILKTLGGKEMKLIFTSSATEASNQIIAYFRDKNIVFCDGDHPSISKCAKGKVYKVIEDPLSKIDETTDLLILSQVNSQSGYLRNCNDIASKAKEINPKIKVMVDGVQALGKVPVDLSSGVIDYFIFASHKLGGPKGVAGLAFKGELAPLIVGGPQEEGYRSSTISAPLIFAFSKAIEISLVKLSENLIWAADKRKFLETELKEVHSSFEPILEMELCSPYILCLVFKGMPSDVLLRLLESKEVYISSSTACSSKVKVNNPVFPSHGIEKKYEKNVLRVSFSSQTKNEEFEQFINELKEIINQNSFLIK